MRKILSISGFVSALALMTSVMGCSAPTDSTMNRGDETNGDATYPIGPYGYVENSTVANYKFLGKLPTAGAYGDTAAPLLLGQYHADPANKLLLVEGSAGWCYFCNQEAPNVEKMANDHAAEGFKALTVLAEGHTRGVPSTPDDITDWVNSHEFHTTNMGIDPEARLFQYAPASAFPLHILVDTKSMKILWLCVGGIGACDSEAAVSDALGSL